MGRKRSLSNEAELVRALRSSAAATSTYFPPHASPPGLDVQRYVGSDKLTLAATAQVGLAGVGQGLELWLASSRASSGMLTRQMLTTQLFSRAALLTGPHGGAFLNMIYCSAGTPVVEIGYARARSPDRSS